MGQQLAFAFPDLSPSPMSASWLNAYHISNQPQNRNIAEKRETVRKLWRNDISVVNFEAFSAVVLAAMRSWRSCLMTESRSMISSSASAIRAFGRR